MLESFWSNRTLQDMVCCATSSYCHDHRMPCQDETRKAHYQKLKIKNVQRFQPPKQTCFFSGSASSLLYACVCRLTYKTPRSCNASCAIGERYRDEIFEAFYVTALMIRYETLSKLNKPNQNATICVTVQIRLQQEDSPHPTPRMHLYFALYINLVLPEDISFVYWSQVSEYSPNLLFNSCRVCRNSQYLLHLLQRSEKNVSSDKESDSLSAWRTCETTAISPEFTKISGFHKCRLDVDGCRNRGGVIERWSQTGELSKEGREDVHVSRINANGKDSQLMSISISHNQVQFGL